MSAPRFPTLLEILDKDTTAGMLSLIAAYFLIGTLILVKFLRPKTAAELAGVVALAIAWNIA